MRQIVINRLFESFTQLEKAVNQARESLESQSNPPEEVLERIDNYENVLRRQRELAFELCRFAHNKEWEEVTRHIRLINGLSTMIRDDAKEILQAAEEIPEYEHRDALLV